MGEGTLDRRCGFTVVAADGTEEPCDRPAPSWRWYQGHDHEDALDVACELHENEGGRRMASLQAKVDGAWQHLDCVRDLMNEPEPIMLHIDAALADLSSERVAR